IAESGSRIGALRPSTEDPMPGDPRRGWDSMWRKSYGRYGSVQQRRCRPLVEAMEARRLLATFTVANTNDSGPGSLRQAILDPNSREGLDGIAFSIPGAGVHTIHPVGELPEITDPVIIDGTTQPGFDPGNPRPIIELSGGSGGGDGLFITAGDSTVRGLVINSFGIGIFLRFKGGNIIAGNYIRTAVS